MLSPLIYLLACLLIPVLWGAIVNWMFDLWQRREPEAAEEETGFPDYQI